MAIGVILATMLAVFVLLVALLRDGHPENGCGHGEHSKDKENERFYSSVDRPAGPDAEDASLERARPAPHGRTSRRRRLAFRSAKP